MADCSVCTIHYGNMHTLPIWKYTQSKTVTAKRFNGHQPQPLEVGGTLTQIFMSVSHIAWDVFLIPPLLWRASYCFRQPGGHQISGRCVVAVAGAEGSAGTEKKKPWNTDTPCAHTVRVLPSNSHPSLFSCFPSELNNTPTSAGHLDGSYERDGWKCRDVNKCNHVISL